jgi:hypothetical protein
VFPTNHYILDADRAFQIAAYLGQVVHN